MKVGLKENHKSAVRVCNGNYKRRFDPAQQPYEVTDEEWATLEGTGLFQPVAEATKESNNAAPEDKGNGDQSSNSDESADETQDSQTTGSKKAAKRKAVEGVTQDA